MTNYNAMPPGPEMDVELLRVFNLPIAEYSTNIGNALKALQAVAGVKGMSFVIGTHDNTGTAAAMLFVDIQRGNFNNVGSGSGGAYRDDLDSGEGDWEPWDLETALPAGIVRALLFAGTAGRERLAEVKGLAGVLGEKGVGGNGG